MTRRALPALAGVGLAVLFCGALAGCAAGAGGTGTASAPPSGSASAPDDSELTKVEVDAAWLDEGRMIGLITMGSSTCVPVVEDSGIQDNGTLGVLLAEGPGDTACTRDMVPRVTLVSVPAGIDPSVDLEIAVAGDTYYGDTELRGVAGLDPLSVEEGAVSAGWTDIAGTFVILTWGSSSCLPVVTATEATGSAQVTVTLETPPADQVCTMDFGARGTLATVDGLSVDDGVELVLTGAEYGPGIALPIYGSN